jgi:hypothetical protein
MIRRMCKRVLAALLIVGWVSLSGFDLVEDIDEIPGQSAVSSTSPEDNSKSKFGGWGPLANNIVESANRIPEDYGTLVTFTAIIFDLDAFLDFRKHFALHKLYRVFLI